MDKHFHPTLYWVRDYLRMTVSVLVTEPITIYGQLMTFEETVFQLQDETPLANKSFNSMSQLKISFVRLSQFRPRGQSVIDIPHTPTYRSSIEYCETHGTITVNCDHTHKTTMKRGIECFNAWLARPCINHWNARAPHIHHSHSDSWHRITMTS